MSLIRWPAMVFSEAGFGTRYMLTPGAIDSDVPSQVRDILPAHLQNHGRVADQGSLSGQRQDGERKGSATNRNRSNLGVLGRDFGCRSHSTITLWDGMN